MIPYDANLPSVDSVGRHDCPVGPMLLVLRLPQPDRLTFHCLGDVDELVSLSECHPLTGACSLPGHAEALCLANCQVVEVTRPGYRSLDHCPVSNDKGGKRGGISK